MRKHFLDGIRGWASLMVVLAHVLRGIAKPAVPSYDKKFLLFVSDGTLAVYIFFVVSGFALSAAYFETGKSKLLTNTALRRYPRLTLPILLSSFLAFLVLQCGLVFSHQAAVFANSGFWLGTFFNFKPSFFDLLRFSLFDVYFNYDSTRTYNPALWTMSIELSGSMLVLGFLAVFGTVRRMPVYLVAMITLSLLKSPLLSFVFGMILSEFFTQTPKPRLLQKPLINLASCAAIICTIVFSTFGGQFYGDPRLLSVAALLLVFSFTQIDLTRSFLEDRLSAFLGKISFPLYLTHTTVIVSFSSYVLVFLSSHGFSRQASVNYMVLTTIPLCLLVASIFSPVESAAIRLGYWFSSLFEKKAHGQQEEKLAAD